MQITVIGDSWLERDAVRTSPDGDGPVTAAEAANERPAGAALAALALRRLGHEVTLVTATAGDRAGSRLRQTVVGARANLVNVPVSGPTVEDVPLVRGAPDHRRRRYLPPATSSIPPGIVAGAALTIERSAAVLVVARAGGLLGLPALRSAIGTCSRETTTVWSTRDATPHPDAGSAVLLLDTAALAPGRRPGSLSCDAVVRRARSRRIDDGAHAVVVLDDDHGIVVVPRQRGEVEVLARTSNAPRIDGQLRAIVEAELTRRLAEGEQLLGALDAVNRALGGVPMRAPAVTAVAT